METLQGTIERVTFYNPDTGHSVLRVHARGKRGVVTLVGKALGVTAGELVQAAGSWVFDPQYGEQFRAEEITLLPPSSAEGIEKYLASGLVKGIGPKYARKIVEVFRERTLQVIDESPSFLKEVKGIGPQRIAKIRESWREQKAVRDIMVFLQGHGIGTQKAVRIYKTYGDRAVEVVKEDPYRLAADVWGVGFHTADQLGQRMGIELSSPRRAKAALRHTLKVASQEFGHVCMPEGAAVAMALEKVEGLPEPVVREAIEVLRKEGELVREPGNPPYLYLKPLFLAEIGIARAVQRLRQGGHPLPDIELGPALARIEERMGLQFAPQQRQAVAAAAQEKVLVITGGPGVGKTTIVRGILELFASRRLRVGLCAPTGRAARRLSETCGREARTIHRLLEFDAALGGFKRTAANPLELDLLVIDECSMVDVSLMNSALRAVPKHACVVLVGDVDQLPSVGPGRVLADLIASNEVPVARLTEVFRQARESWIVRAAHAIREGEIPSSAPVGEGDFYFVEADTPAAIRSRLLTMVRERIPAKFGLDPVREIQVLTPMNRGELGTEALNKALQDALNPGNGGASVRRFEMEFRVGDKVMQTQNNYSREVFNGDLGRVASINEAERELVVDFDGRQAVYDFGELDELMPAYAVTTHRAQGSEYPAVVIPLHTQHFKLLQRNLLYTAVTRGKRLVVVVGSRQALEMAVGNQDTRHRFSLLARRIGEGPREEDGTGVAD
jgi:exodeoxyribonuclease V alpha subunit